MPRFVILRHEPDQDSPRPLHWDLMLESAGALRTWALDCEPAPNRQIDAQQLADHRLAYLDYEGPVAGRGSVKRWDAGTCAVTSDSEEEVRLVLTGRVLQCTASLVRVAGQPHRWKVVFSEGTTGSAR
jgi:hypothetical protein